MRFLKKIRSLLFRRTLDAEMAEEMRHHLELQAERNRATGMMADEADYVARRQFGNVASLQQQAREGRGWIWLEQAWQDFRYALRSLRKTPRFALTMILSLGLGIGVSTSVFSLIEAR